MPKFERLRGVIDNWVMPRGRCEKVPRGCTKQYLRNYKQWELEEMEYVGRD
jgi:hypothetical protein